MIRRFLTWDRPLLAQAIELLVGDWQGSRPLDLSDQLIVVPTRQAGRRLREALAAAAAERGQAAFPPRVVTPETLLNLAPPPDAATRLESLLAWVEVFRTLPLDEFRDVFPIDPPQQNFDWALRVAGEFSRVELGLAESALGLADVMMRAGENFPELARWERIGALGARHETELAAMGRRALSSIQRRAVETARPPAGIRRVWMMATPDPLPLAIATLVGFSATVPVEVVIYTSADEAENFDEWGRPRAEAWGERELVLPEFEDRVHLRSNPAAQAAWLARVARGYSDPEGILAIGLADPDLPPLVENELHRARIRTFNPEGKPRRAGRFYQLVKALGALVDDPHYENVRAVARCPDYIEWLRERAGGRFSLALWLSGLDRLHARHLPPDLAAAFAQASRDGRAPEVTAGLAAMLEIRDVLLAESFAAGTAEALRRIFGGRRLQLGRDDDSTLMEDAQTWTELLRELAVLERAFPKLSRVDWWTLALRFFGETVATAEKEPGALELQGWLELLWENAPHLVVAGCNDGRVPESVVGDSFLPETLRATLGLKTNAARLARDAYILQAIVHCRDQAGRVDILFGKASSAGEPLRPSRLLLRCADELLPRRIEFLFGEPAAEGGYLAWDRAWQLAPRREPPPLEIPVTALRDFLRCPWRFYLRRALRMEAVEPEKTELSEADFGTLCHAALEAISDTPELRDCEDPIVLREVLGRELDRQVRQRYGAELTLPLLVQVESARQRLGAAAEVEAAERKAGWRTLETEAEFSLYIESVRVSGKIDRIDHNHITGRWRVVDYKTSDQKKSPAQAHLRPLKADETVPEWAILDLGGGADVWRDLQLPLYIRSRVEAGGGSWEAAYFDLPKAVGETGVTTWMEYTALHAASAAACAAGVCASIREGKFWPPNEDVKAEHDDFAALFHYGVAASVAEGAHS